MTSEPATQNNASLLERLREPFSPDEIFWLVVDVAQDRSGLVHAYAKKRSYHDRLNKLFTTAGWSTAFTPNIIPIQRIKGGKVISTGKVYVTCVLSIEGLGSHTSLGESWADEDNGIAAAEVQAFKRACVQFGLGRYLDLLNAESSWVALDHRKQPVVRPELPRWALPKAMRGKAAQPTIVPTQPEDSTKASKATVEKAEPTSVKAQPSGIPAQTQLFTDVSMTKVPPAGPTVEEQFTRFKADLGESLFNSVVEHVSDYFAKGKYGSDREKKTLECCNRAQQVLEKLRWDSERVGEARFGAVLDEHNVSALNAFSSIDQLVRVAMAFDSIAA